MHQFPVGISSSCQCKRAFSMGKQWERHKTRYGNNGDAAHCLTGQNASVHVVLAGLHIHTGRLGWRDFGFEFWEQQEASASARPCSIWPQLCYGELQAWRAWMLLDDITCARTWSPSPRALWLPGSIRSAGSSLLYHRSISPSQSINSNPIHTHLKHSIVCHLRRRSLINTPIAT